MADQPSDTSQVATETQVMLSRIADYRISFANNIRVGVGMSELVIHFGNMEAFPGMPPMIAEHTSIAMAPYTAKHLATALQSLVDIYEEKFGSIRTPTIADSFDLNVVQAALTAAQTKDTKGD